MKLLRILSAQAALAILLLSPVTMAQDAAKSVQFASPEIGSEPPAAGTPQDLLKHCDLRVEVCERDAVGVPFLAAAYMAIWAILIAFLVVNRRGQRRLELELAELERRLDGPGGSTA